ncbi:MAG: rhombosortase [Pseudomonadota bacterium]
MTRSDLLLATAFVSVLVLAQVGLEGLGLPLRYERGGLAAGELWRAVSGHLVHLGWVHLALNAAAFVLLALLAASARLAVVLCLLFAPLISAALFVFAPHVEWYVGLSAALHGLFAWIALDLVREGERLGWLGLIGLCVKLGFEQWNGPDTWTGGLIGGAVVIESHLYGAAAGALCWPLARAVRGLFRE